MVASASAAECARARSGIVDGSLGLGAGTPVCTAPAVPGQVTSQTSPWQIVLEGRIVPGLAGSVW